MNSSMDKPLVTVIVTTKNNHATLEACLKSIKEQTYEQVELVVVDNNSTDDTKDIAGRFTSHVFNKGPERSTQRNYAVEQSTGQYVAIIDSDMVLSPEVVEQAVALIERNTTVKGIIIPEESFGEGFWAKCKQLERSFYVGQDSIEAARFFDKATFQQVGGYNVKMTGGEDWDLTKRIRAIGDNSVDRIEAYVYHNEGRPRFTRTVKKMYYYAQQAQAYFAENPTTSALTDKSGPLARYKLFFSKPGKLFRNPIVGIGMLTLKTAEYAAGGLGMLMASHKRTDKANA